MSLQSDAVKIHSVVIRYVNGTGVCISGDEIERMEKAADAIEMLNRAKEIARRLVDVSSE